MTVKIVIVGGGAGGLPLATSLGKRLGRKGRASITLVDANATHIWKPRFHEVATGAIDADLDAVDYRAHAQRNHYRFALGTMSGIRRDTRQLVLAPLCRDDGEEILPERTLDYDYLVLAVGSVGNDFNTPGVREHCLFLDSRHQADRFHELFLDLCLRVDYSASPFSLAIVGGGATGVELAAELHHAVALLKSYGHEQLDRARMTVHVIEAGPRLLPALKEELAATVRSELEQMGVAVHVDTKVQSADERGFVLADGGRIDADLLVWAAGIKAPEILPTLGLGANRLNQIPVNKALQSEDPRVFVMGDCCACELEDGKNVPPRAQSAQQMAKHLSRNLQRLIDGQPLADFAYRDHGSLVSLSNYAAVGNLMGSLRGGSIFVEGWMARMMYISLYRLHQAALYGWLRTLMLLLAGRFNRLWRPRLKLH
ncbi:MAG: NAD(P)/FAD-dependent oxidoreductase [Spongiibacter sp.]|uniref:NAD(P)/FAD-dependent oxidoreductase n=1 Tax=Spongiibacter thalassae TaxID=2721624 RepID=A0ABX1GEL2_9GAMM|nr:NAD(P)/FAD-dependent oxidoreductase [Spongiibacter thalassae]MDX1505122.1 NAD(P)/FAD-dependent oxidoreductase [Spongiibacter sp.]NKI17644.1 NAD(P)/FAD-dependent oxidoreductase [Spongiibacter thalassae]